MQEGGIVAGPLSLPIPIGLPRLAQLAFDSADLAPLRLQLAGHYAEHGGAGVLLDLAVLDAIMGRPDMAQSMQDGALITSRLYHRRLSGVAPGCLPILVVMASGDLMANTPLEFLLEGSGFTIEFVFCRPGEALPDNLPPHAIVFVAIGHSDKHHPTLLALSDQLGEWPVPVINPPGAITQLSRTAVVRRLHDGPGLYTPQQVRVERSHFLSEALAFAQAGGDTTASPTMRPILVRPTQSHAGRGLQHIADTAALADYLASQTDSAFFLSEFVDYSDSTGMFRKYRIAFVDGVPYPSHMAVSSHWMIHYLNAGMAEDSGKRAEEAAWMRDFHSEFAVRHRQAFATLISRVGLDYFQIDCGETVAGDLLIFEVDTAMLIHAMDCPHMFAYKQEPMRQLFAAVQAMCHRRASVSAQPAMAYP